MAQKRATHSPSASVRSFPKKRISMGRFSALTGTALCYLSGWMLVDIVPYTPTTRCRCAGNRPVTVRLRVSPKFAPGKPLNGPVPPLHQLLPPSLFPESASLLHQLRKLSGGPPPLHGWGPSAVPRCMPFSLCPRPGCPCCSGLRGGPGECIPLIPDGRLVFAARKTANELRESSKGVVGMYLHR